MEKTMTDEVVKKPKRKWRRSRILKTPRVRGARATSKIKKTYTAIAARPEHYYMLRELAEFYKAPMARTVGAIIVNEYCRVLAKSDPAKALEIREIYKNDKTQFNYIVDLNS
jgi:hypothetical protein